MGKELETAVVTKAGTKEVPWLCCALWSVLTAAAAGEGKRGLPPALAQLGTSRSMPQAPHCLVLRCIFVFFFLLCERRKRKQTARSLFKLAHSDTLGQILDTHARERPWLKAPEKNQMLPTQRKLT